MLSALVYKFCACLLESCYRVEGELVIAVDLNSRTGDDHGTEGFVGFSEVFDNGIGYGDQVGFKVFRVMDDERRVDDCR